MLLPQGTGAGGGALVVLALAAVASASSGNSALLFLPPLRVNLGLAWLSRAHVGARTCEALITRFARLEHAAPAPQILAYTRRLTWVWTVFSWHGHGIGRVGRTGAHAAWVWFTAVGNYLHASPRCSRSNMATGSGAFPSDSRASPGRQLEMLREGSRMAAHQIQSPQPGSMNTATTLPLLRGFDAHQALLFEQGRSIECSGVLRHRLTAVANRLPRLAFRINLCDGRAEFLLASAAAILAGTQWYSPPSGSRALCLNCGKHFPTATASVDGPVPAMSPRPAKSPFALAAGTRFHARDAATPPASW